MSPFAPTPSCLPSKALGRPRSQARREAILKAAYAILIETGLSQFSIDAVATRAKVARTTIYRWWPSKGVLAIESFLVAFRPQLTLVSTGRPAADFQALVCSLATALGGPAGRVAASVVAVAQSDDDVRRMFLEDFSKPLRQQSSAMLRAGVDAGDFRRDLDIEGVLDASIGAVYLRLLLGQPTDAAWADRLTRTILEGCLCRQH